MNINFDTLKPKDIECKAVVVGNFIEVSLHIQAHTCTKILNNTFGAMGWEKTYTNGNKNCIVRVWDGDKNQWVSKEDCGGSLTEIDGYKGQASNGFKRACSLGWGLGVELYSQPTIRFPRTDDNTIIGPKNEFIVSEKYSVKEIEYNPDREIIHCVIINRDGIPVYDGPNNDGESNIAYPTPKDDVPDIPENADMINSEQEEINCLKNSLEQNSSEKFPEELPNNTDDYEELNTDFINQKVPFENIDYHKEIEQQIARTRVKRKDVLTFLNIDSFDKLDTVNEELINKTLDKLKAMPTRRK